MGKFLTHINKTKHDLRKLRELTVHLSQEDLNEFYSDLQAAREADRNSDELNALFFEMRVEHNDFKSKPASQTNRVDWQKLLAAFVPGFIAGVISWMVIKDSSAGYSTQQFNMIVLACFLTGVAYLLYSYRQIQSVTIFATSFLSFLLLVVLSSVVDRGRDFAAFYTFIAAVGFFVSIGFIAFALSESNLRQVPNALYKYLDKVTEVVIISTILYVPLFIVYGLVFGLLNLININLSDDFWLLIATLISTTVPFCAVALSYNFKLKLTEQNILFIIKISVKLSLFLILLLTPILTLYVLVLLPSGFAAILETGQTVSIFMGITLATMGITVATVEGLVQGGLQSQLSRLVRFAQVGITALGILLTVVSAYALYVRVASYGFTFDRITVGFGIALAFVILLVYLGVLLLVNNNQQWHKALYYLRAATIAGIVLLLGYGLLNTVIDLEAATIHSYFTKHLATAREGDIIDRNFMISHRAFSAELIAEKLAAQNKVKQLDMLMTLRYIGTYYGSVESHQKRISAVLTKAVIDTEGSMQELAEMIKVQTNQGDLARTPFANIQEKCLEVAAEIGLSASLAQKYCSYY